MATPLDQARISAGDLFLFKGDGRFARLIKDRTNSQYSHIGSAVPLFDGDESRWLVGEAVLGAGVRLFPLQRYLAEGETVDWFRLEPDLLRSHDCRWKVLRFVFDRLGDRYDLVQLSWSFGWIGSLWRKLSGRPTDLHPQEFFCSELVSAALQKAGLELPKEPSLMTPQDVAELPFVSFQETLTL